jgi:hypothetical protein
VLWSYDGTNFTEIEMPTNFLVSESSRFKVFKNKLYMALHNPNTTLQDSHLFAFDGSSFEQIPLPENLHMTIVEMEIYQDDLYMVLSDHHLYRYDGKNVSLVEAPKAQIGYYDMEVWDGALFYVSFQESLLGYQIDGPIREVALPYSSFVPTGYSMKAFNEYLYFYLEDHNRGPVRFLYEWDGDTMIQVNVGDGYRCTQYTDALAWGSQTKTTKPKKRKKNEN